MVSIRMKRERDEMNWEDSSKPGDDPDLPEDAATWRGTSMVRECTHLVNIILFHDFHSIANQCTS